MMLVYSKFSDDRAKNLSIRTDIIKNDGVLSVRKYPSFDEAKDHIIGLKDKYEQLQELFKETKLSANKCELRDDYAEFEYVNGVMLEELADKGLASNKRSLLNEIFGEFFAVLDGMATEKYVCTPGFRQVFGDAKIPEDVPCMKVSDIELIFSNILADGDIWNVIDYEWTFSFPIPVNYIKWRAIHYYVEGNSKRVFLKNEGIFDILGANEHELSNYRKMEESFQQYVKTGHTTLGEFYEDISAGFVPVREIVSEYDRLTPKKMSHLYYTAGDFFSEKDSYIFKPADNQVTETVEINGMKKFRLDPAEMPVLLHIDIMSTDTGRIKIKHDNTNGSMISERDILFTTEDPWVEITDFPEGSKKLNISYSFWPLEKGAASVLEADINSLACELRNRDNIIAAESSDLERRRVAASELERTKTIRAYRKLARMIGRPDPFAGVNPPFEGSSAVINYSIDQKSYGDNIVIIRGWAFAKYAPTEKVEFFDAAGNPVKAEVKRVERDDVCKIFEIGTGRKLGFLAQIKNEDLGTLPLNMRISEPRGFSQIEIPLELDVNKRRERRRLIIEGKIKADSGDVLDYNDWYREYCAPDEKELEEQRNTHFENEPLISVVIPLYNTPRPFLKVICDSIMNQTYSRVQLCLADGSTEDEVGEFIKKNYIDVYNKEEDGFERVVYERLTENKGISENTNAAIKLATGEFIMLSDHDDEVTPDACFEIVKAINESDCVDVVYTDEDKITMDGMILFDPHFKPDFDLDLLRSNNYICHIFVVRKNTLDEAGLFKSEYDGAQDFDFILRMCEKAREIKHVAKPLYHWRSHPASTAGNPESKMYAYENGKNAVQAHYDRLGIDAKASMTKYFGRYRSEFAVQGKPFVSIIIPSKDHSEDLRRAIDSIFEKTYYQNFEIIVIENGSTLPETEAYYNEVTATHSNVKIVRYTEPFNYSKVNNFGVKYAKGEYLLFLNNDVEVISPGWMSEMLGYCQRDDVGACGARLYYPDDTVQHTGVVIGLGGAAGHIFYGVDREAFTYAGRGNSTQDLSAVTAACMMTKKSLFESVGGFDEKFVVAFNDADYCLKLREKGLLVVMNVYAELYHYESISRGSDKAAVDTEKHERFLSEANEFRAKWPEYFEKGDPYYNINLDYTRGDFTFKGQFPIQEDHEAE